ncbi:MAG: glycosyltransferase family 2 protein [Rikenellaceae bacterium]
MELKSVLVSIIIPCYNQARYLIKTINSVFNQSYQNWECIIINDGSTDNTKEIALDLTKRDKRVHFINQVNQGVCVARNNAIKKSKGKYILCLDADDLISPNFLVETVKLLEENDDIKVATSTVYFFGRRKGKLVPKSYSLEILLAQNQLVITSLFRRSDFNRIGGFSNSMSEGFEDWDFWIRMIKDGGKIECAEDAIFYYRLLRSSRNSNIDNDKESRLRFKLWDNHKELYSKYFVNPKDTFEYLKVANSKEFKIGKIILKPIRMFKW